MDTNTNAIDFEQGACLDTHALPESLRGAVVRPPPPQGAEGARIVRVTAPSDLYVAIDGRAREKPAWMTEWIDSGLDMTVRGEAGETVAHDLYRHLNAVAPGDEVVLGPNPTTAPTDYVILVAPAEERPAGWDAVPGILARIVPPTFPDRDFVITDYGAQGDGTSMCTDAFANAMRACSEAGGGRVVVPEGDFLTGPIHFASNVELHVQGTVLFSQNPDDYLPPVFTTWEGTDLYNYSPLIYALDKENIAITGPGTINGQADDEHWWHWKETQAAAQTRSRLMNNNRVPVEERVFGKGDGLRPELIQFIRCRNVLVRDITLRNSPFWASLYTWCENVTVSGITVISHRGNNDGCNPNSSRYMLIENCDFHTGDDGVAIKAGRNYDGRKHGPTGYVVIRNCTFTADDSYPQKGNCLLAIGSEMSGGVHDVYIDNCKAVGPLNTGVIKTKTSDARGGYFMNIYARDIDASEVTSDVKFWTKSTRYNDKGTDIELTWPTVYRNLHIEEGER